MKKLLIFCISVSFLVSSIISPAPARLRGDDVVIVRLVSLSASTDSDNTGEVDASGDEAKKRSDPSYGMYKEGYELILEERWEKAREKLAQFMKKYPKSEYVDDAAYWSAYALKHTDKQRARDAYKTFLVTYPTSRYYDDAVADYSNLLSRPVITGVFADERGTAVYVDDKGDGLKIRKDRSTRSDSSVPGRMTVTKVGPGSYSYSIGTEPAISSLERQLRLHSQRLRSIRIPGQPPLPPMGPPDNQDLDHETRLKLEALYALGDSRQDSASFVIFRDVALDRSQVTPLRIAAMEQLVDYRKHDPLPIFLQIARTDTSETIQSQAIECIGLRSSDKQRSVETLIDLFNAIPKHRKTQRESIFFTIADIGNDRAVEFLSSVARGHDDYALRSQAIFYLGNIGTDRSRKVLLDILRTK